jgi:hypothetical protein
MLAIFDTTLVPFKNFLIQKTPIIAPPPQEKGEKRNNQEIHLKMPLLS